MKKLYFLLLSLSLLCCISACKKNGGTGTVVNPNLILGKWTLQQQKSVIYLNGIKQTDTTYQASSFNFGHLQFNNNGTFTSSSYSISGINGGPLGSGVSNIVSQDSTHGSYNIVNPNINMSTSIAGFGIYVYGTTSTSVAPVGLLVPEVSQITQLTSSSLTIHKEYVYSLTGNTYKDVLDYHYTK